MTTSGVVSGFGAFFAYQLLDRDGGPPVQFVDNTEQVRALFDARAAEVQAAPLPLTVDATTTMSAPTTLTPTNVAGSEPEPEPTDPEPVDPEPAALATPPGLVRETIDEETARTALFRLLQYTKKYHYEPVAHLWQHPSLEQRQPFPEHPDGGWTNRTNALGFRKDHEVRKEPPDVRILVSGDSHTAGMVPNDESFPNVLEELLGAGDPQRTFEGLNAGIGGTAPYSYLGMLELWKDELTPDVFVVTFYGGNDFKGVLSLHRYFNRLPSPTFGPYGGQRLTKRLPSTGLLGQQLAQVAFFLDNPDDVVVSREAVRGVTLELQRQCDEAGIRLVCVYLPPAHDVQPQFHAEDMRAALEKLEFEPDVLEISDRLAGEWLAFLEEQEIELLDLRPVLRAIDEPCYWLSDLHLNTRGHRAVAEALAPIVAGTPD
jgi:lysophospholipase L1-like esterase